MLLKHRPSRILKPPDSGATNGPTFVKMVDHSENTDPHNGRPFEMVDHFSQMVDHFAKWSTIWSTNWLQFSNGRPFDGRHFSKWSTIEMVGTFGADH